MAQIEKVITDFVWYRNRSQAVVHGIDLLIDEFSGLVDPDAKWRLNTIVPLLTRLREFGQAHFNFFANGFENETLQIVSDFPPARVLEAVVNQIGFDFEVLWRAAMQRRSTKKDITNALARADKVAMQAVNFALATPKPLEGVPKDGDWTVLTYLQKSPAVRVIPYANAVLIGVPVTCLGEPRDFLAIAHEVGHAAYWRRTVNHANDPVNREILTVTDKISDVYRSWQEELFADVFGALCAGAIIGLDFQDLALEHALGQFLDEADDHAAPILRPYVYTKVFAATGQGALAEKLHARWKRRATARMKQAMAVGALSASKENLVARGNAEAATFALGNGLDKTIERALEILGARNQNDWTGDAFEGEVDAETQRDAAAPIGIAAVQNMYDGHITKVNNLIKNRQVPPLGNLGMDGNVWDRVMARERFFDGQLAGEWLATHGRMDAGTLDELRLAATNKWLQIWLATGWTSEGPGAEPKSP